MKGWLSSLCILTWIIAPLYSQQLTNQSPIDPYLEDSSPISRRLDELNRDYSFNRTRSSVYDTLILNTYQFSPDEVPKYSTKVIEQRLADLPAMIPMTYNQYVQVYIDLYTIRRREQMSRMLGLSKVYFPIFEQELDKAGLPLELKYLSIVESALNPRARSRAGAVGLWQFMLWTAKSYGLKINSYVDERRDPYKSTVAAVAYLKDAYEEFGDWLLAIASYNCGRGNVRKAILRSGGKRNFWEIRRYLPRETRGYVPGFIGATYSFEYAAEHNLYPIYVDLDMEQDTVHIKRMNISLTDIADMTRSDVNILKQLNPELKQNRIPYMGEDYILHVPSHIGEYFAQHGRRIQAKYGKNRLVSGVSRANQTSSSQYIRDAKKKSQKDLPAGKPIYYTVQSGDVVGAISEKFHVSPRQIAYWNDLRGYRIKVGQKIAIYAKPSQDLPSSTTTSLAALKTSVLGPENINPTYYTIQRGDTLWDIAKRNEGMNVSKILALNPGLKAEDLDVGQKIRIK